MQYLLDTDTFSALAKQLSPPAERRLDAIQPGQAGISVVTLGEIEFGLKRRPVHRRMSDRIAALRGVLAPLPLGVNVAVHYATLRAHLQKSGTPIGPNDLWLAAHALAENLIVVTGNEREFNRVPALRIENWLR